MYTAKVNRRKMNLSARLYFNRVTFFFIVPLLSTTRLPKLVANSAMPLRSPPAAAARTDRAKKGTQN